MGPPRVGPRRVEPKRGPERWEAQHFALFFLPTPAGNFHSSLPLLGVLPWNFSGVGSAGASSVHVWNSTRRPPTKMGEERMKNVAGE